MARVRLKSFGRARPGFRGTPGARRPALSRKHQVAVSRRFAEIHDPRLLAPTLQQVLESLARSIEENFRDVDRELTGLLTPSIGVFKSDRTVTATTTLTVSDDLLLADATSGAITVNLPAVASLPGREFTVKKIDSSANAVTLDGNASETIDGSTTAALASQYDSVRISNDGSEWWVL